MDFGEGMAWIELGGKRGYIDSTGKMVIKPQFNLAMDFKEGLARIKLGSKWGYIDSTGKMVIKPQFDDAEDFKEGLARTKLGDGLWGYMDKTGKMVIEPQFYEAGDFQEGLAWIGERRYAEYGLFPGYFYRNTYFPPSYRVYLGERKRTQPQNPSGYPNIYSIYCGYTDKTGK